MGIGLTHWHDTLVVLDNFGRQLLQDIFLGSSQNERRNPPLKRLECINELLSVFQLLLHFLDVSGKILVISPVEGGFFL